MTGLCVCEFCKAPVDSRIALSIVRSGGVAFCDRVCARAYDNLLDDRVKAAIGDIVEDPGF